MIAETSVGPAQLIQPLFVVAGRGVEQPIASLPGVARLSVDRAVEQGKRLIDAGIPAVLLFGEATAKDATGSSAWAEGGVVQEACRSLRESVPGLILITDVCLCAYIDHGHCGVVAGRTIDNDATVPLLARIAVSHAQAGAHIVAPSDMMDGRVGAIRRALDDACSTTTAIMSYAVKYASAFYGPFREAQSSSPHHGDRTAYQMDPANRREALREARLDVEEGADFIMVKPALPSLDVISAVRAAVDVPIVAYQVSGEYAMLKAAAAHGWLNEQAALREMLLAIRRAGADLIITYGALQAL